LPPPADEPPVPTVDAELEPEPEPAADPPVPTLELLLPPPADVPPVPSVEAAPEPEPAADPPVPTLELLMPPPAEVPPVPSVEAEPLPDPADEPPVPTLELLVPPPADVPPVPTVELDCATASAVPASNAAAAAEIFRTFIGGLLFLFFQASKNYALSKEDDLRNVPACDVAFSIFPDALLALSNIQNGTGIVGAGTHRAMKEFVSWRRCAASLISFRAARHSAST
jgi:hypothetical protein